MNEKNRLFRIELSLKDKQMLELNKWSLTLSGEPRIVTSKRVEFHSQSLTEAANSINQDECERINISW